MSPEEENSCHIPVLLSEMLTALQPSEGKLIIDGCFGAGGYTKAILATGASVVAFDRDPAAIRLALELAEKVPGRLSVFHQTFSAMEKHVSQADGLVLDLGVSSFQLDNAKRGFSFRHDGPLDMRMSSSGISASDVINNWSEDDLAEIFRVLGEERHARALARMIKVRRTKKPFERTLDLADAIMGVLGSREKKHPATRVFQALRIYVNDELTELGKALYASERLLRCGGKLVVISFHSLEDRIVKRFITSRSQVVSVSRHSPPIKEKPTVFKKIGSAVFPSKEEIQNNIRARSARLRAAERTQALSNNYSFDLADIAVPTLSSRWAGERYNV